MYMITLLIVIASLTLVEGYSTNQKSDLDMGYSMNIEDNYFMD